MVGPRHRPSFSPIYNRSSSADQLVHGDVCPHGPPCAEGQHYKACGGGLSCYDTPDETCKTKFYHLSANGLLGRYGGLLDRACGVHYGRYPTIGNVGGGAKLWGFDVTIEKHDGQILEICQKQCEENPDCGYWEYDCMNEKCYLKEKSEGWSSRSVTVENDHFITGKKCPENRCEETEELWGKSLPFKVKKCKNPGNHEKTETDTAYNCKQEYTTIDDSRFTLTEEESLYINIDAKDTDNIPKGCTEQERQETTGEAIGNSVLCVLPIFC